MVAECHRLAGNHNFTAPCHLRTFTSDKVTTSGRENIYLATLIVHADDGRTFSITCSGTAPSIAAVAANLFLVTVSRKIAHSHSGPA